MVMMRVIFSGGEKVRLVRNIGIYNYICLSKGIFGFKVFFLRLIKCFFREKLVLDL